MIMSIKLSSTSLLWHITATSVFGDKFIIQSNPKETLDKQILKDMYKVID